MNSQSEKERFRDGLVVGEVDYNELIEPVGYDFGLSRRSFVQILGAGLLLVVSGSNVRVAPTESPISNLKPPTTNLDSGSLSPQV